MPKSAWPVIVLLLVLGVATPLLFSGELELPDLEPSNVALDVPEFRLRVSVEATKPNGRKWDPGGDPPDPFGDVQADGRFVGRIDIRQNRYRFTAGKFDVERVSDVQSLRVCLTDRDLRFHDSMGCVSLSPSGDQLSARNESFAVTLLPVSAAPVAP